MPRLSSLSFSLLFSGAIASITLPLVRRAPSVNPADLAEWRDQLLTKYGDAPRNEKRQTNATVAMTNQNTDTFYYAPMHFGTPPRAYNVILDTGSSDLWLVDSECFTGCSSVATFDYTSSSTFTLTNRSLSIRYGSGSVSGSLGTDIISMAGFTVQDQVFGVINNLTADFLFGNVSGLLGLGFEQIANSRAKPFWQTLVERGDWTQPLMSFYFTRLTNDTSATDSEPGGQFTMGATNSSLYRGDIDWINIPDGLVSYWLILLTQIYIGGAVINVNRTTTAPTGEVSVTTSLAAIDTGTTLIGGPPDYIRLLYSHIPDAFPATGRLDRYWVYPCETQVSISLRFGSNQVYNISGADFLRSYANEDRTLCIGSFFELELRSTSRRTPQWVFGDAFLKNVYSIFRYNPPSVGFAQLSGVSGALPGVDFIRGDSVSHDAPSPSPSGTEQSSGAKAAMGANLVSVTGGTLLAVIMMVLML